MSKRMFLGVSPTAAQTQTLLSLQQAIKTDGRPVPADNFHMTLSFLGQLTSTQEQALIHALDKLSRQQKLATFNVCLNRLHHWPKPKVLCIKADLIEELNKEKEIKTGKEIDKANSSALISLHQQCQRLCDKLDISCGDNPLTPHITLFRKARHYHAVEQQSLPVSLIHLQARTLHLYQSLSTDNGVRYPIVHSWPLTN
ncbi:2'-5' RNA ligase family protein [Shewanella sp. Isolate11]|uniref:2'-5' RNA ligase family protein n=1 Tax=Shewanella sp. Isolate11 TaxID=2908530 RepID=UPI001EFD5A8C|nr:2'-5' RNA ligase family protein [Shewanella sp. Isolate11]MCG9695690.1 hypothetical protein [Shewanella sp. Isolate11]